MSRNLKENYYNVKNKIEEAEKASKYKKDVTLIAVSKTKPVSDIQEVYDLGQRDFGENKVQELLQKYDELPKDIRWHLIGHLQTNKVKQVIGKTYLIHSVDSLHLASVISAEAVKKNITVDILVQVNISEDENKYGVSNEDVIQLIKDISILPNINIKGLMTIGKNTENRHEIQQYFADLFKLSIDIKALNIDNVCMNFLSMGMSSDYDLAILEGSNMIRIGTGIFGDRNYL